MTRSVERAYDVLVDEDDDHGCGELPASSCREVPQNAARIIGSLTLTKLGDRIIDAKTVLTWLLTSGGAPAFLIGMLVPVRESGSVLPQAALVSVVRRFAVRKWVWIAGSVGQALSVAAMALLAAVAEGVALGLGILLALAFFALSRSFASVASKDVLGKTVPQGERGQVIGLAGSTSGVVVIAAGLGIGLFGEAGNSLSVIAWLLAGAAIAWMAAAAMFTTVREHRGDNDESSGLGSIVSALGLLRVDQSFRRFIIARMLLFVTALSPPYVVVLANRGGDGSLFDLGLFVAVAGLASFLGSPFWGRFADRSSRWTMAAAAASGTAVVVIFLLLTRIEAVSTEAVVYAAVYFLLMLAHAGARVGRKTYVVDMGEGNRRTDYVAVSNSVIGVMLLVVGGVTSALSGVGPEAALIFLAIMGAAGTVLSATLPDVSGPQRFDRHR